MTYTASFPDPVVQEVLTILDRCYTLCYTFDYEDGNINQQ